MLAREGEEALRKKFRPVAGGLLVTRPLERVEIDEHKLDLIAFIEENDWKDMFTEAQWTKLTFGKRKGRGRFLITLAICAATKCIVGMTITLTANTGAALKTFAMVLSDKGVWADLVGATSPWNMYGRPETIVTDCGTALRSEAFRFACADLGITLERAPAGVPEYRGRVERVLRTTSAGLAARLAGHTFSDIFAKGDRDPEKDVSLTVDDLAFVLVRWIVDVYHNTPHEGLNGETPAACWARLSDEYGVMPPPDMDRFRLAFGTRMTRRLDKTGITVLGVRYHNHVLADFMARRDPKIVDVRWHPEDIGTIAVRIGETWHAIPAVLDGLEGTHAESWLTAVRDVRAGRHKAREIDLRIVLKALAAITARNADAMLRAGVAMDDWSPERIANTESAQMGGVAFREPAPAQADDGKLGRAIPDPIDPPVVHDAAPVRVTPGTARRGRSVPKPD